MIKLSIITVPAILQYHSFQTASFFTPTLPILLIYSCPTLRKFGSSFCKEGGSKDEILNRSMKVWGAKKGKWFHMLMNITFSVACIFKISTYHSAHKNVNRHAKVPMETLHVSYMGHVQGKSYYENHQMCVCSYTQEASATMLLKFRCSNKHPWSTDLVMVACRMRHLQTSANGSW